MRLSNDALESAILLGYMHLAYHIKHSELDGGWQYKKTGREPGRQSGCEFCRPIRGDAAFRR